MTDDERAQGEQELENAERYVAWKRAQLGRAPATDIHRHASQQERLAETFETLTQVEVLELYENDRERWQEMIDAVQAVGERKLFQSRRP